MSDSNNMYVGGKITARDWLSMGRRVKEKIAALAISNKNKGFAIGHTVNLPVRYRDYTPDLSQKNLRNIDYSDAKNCSDEELIQQIEWIQKEVGWYHSIDLREGLSTPGSRGWKDRATHFSIPDRVKGKTVLDIGAMEGGDSLFAESVGAKVTSYDVDNYFEYDLGLNSAWEYVVERFEEARKQGLEKEWIFLNSKRFGYEFCREIRGSKNRRFSGSIYDLDPKVHGTFDIVYCFGLLYHIRHPILALEKIYAVTNEMAFINNHLFTGYTPDSNTVLFFNDTWQGAYTNWFVPSPKAFLEMLSSVGFRKLEVQNCTKHNLSVICYK